MPADVVVARSKMIATDEESPVRADQSRLALIDYTLAEARLVLTTVKAHFNGLDEQTDVLSKLQPESPEGREWHAAITLFRQVTTVEAALTSLADGQPFAGMHDVWVSVAKQAQANAGAQVTFVDLSEDGQ